MVRIILTDCIADVQIKTSSGAKPYLQSLRKFVEALGHSSVIKSTTMSPLLVSSRTAILYADCDTTTLMTRGRLKWSSTQHTCSSQGRLYSSAPLLLRCNDSIVSLPHTTIHCEDPS